MLLRDVNEEFSAFYMEEASVKRKLAHIELHNVSISDAANGGRLGNGIGNGRGRTFYPQPLLQQSQAHLYQRKAMASDVGELNDRLRELDSERKELDKMRKSSTFQRTFVYPLAMLLLLFCTGVTILLVVQNTLELLIGIKALPLSTRVGLIELRSFVMNNYLISYIYLAIYPGHLIALEAGTLWRRPGSVSNLLLGRHLGGGFLQHALHEERLSQAAPDLAATADAKLWLHAGFVLGAAASQQDHR